MRSPFVIIVEFIRIPIDLRIFWNIIDFEPNQKSINKIIQIFIQFLIINNIPLFLGPWERIFQ